jgi:hypothetical protein
MAKNILKGIEIANPLYDVVFRRLMENTRVACYFIETFIGEKIESLTMLAQEITTFKWSKKFDKANFTPEELEQLKQLTVIRLDFVATIKTATGEYKKVLIEIQKARENTDIMRFRSYIAQHYNRTDTITVDGVTKTVPLPIITIYLLGFDLPETEAIVIRVSRTYHDMIKNEAMHIKISLAECLTHDSYIVQLRRIDGKMKTRLEKVLSVFEQRYFIDTKKKITKNYPHATDDKIVRLMLQILEHAGADPEQRAEIEREWLSLEVLNALVKDRDKRIREMGKELVKKDREIETKDKEIETKDKEIETKDKEIETKDKELETKDREIETKDREIETKDRELETKDRELETKDRELETKDRELETKDKEIETKDYTIAAQAKIIAELERKMILNK